MKLPDIAEEDIPQFVNKLLESPQPELDFCILHPKVPAIGICVFVPNESFAKRIGQPKDKIRFAVYATCAACNDDRQDTMARVEAVVLRELQVQ